MNMDFSGNKTPFEVIKEGVFGGSYFRDIYSGKWNRKSWKKIDKLENIDQKYYCWNYCDVSVAKYGVKYGKSLRFWQKKGWINPTDPYAGFSGILDTG